MICRLRINELKKIANPQSTNPIIEEKNAGINKQGKNGK